MKSQKIDDIRKMFKNEWLLISVDAVDKTTNLPTMGTLINHGKSADELWEEAAKHRDPVMVLYSNDWPEDLAACFIIRGKPKTSITENGSRQGADQDVGEL